MKIVFARRKPAAFAVCHAGRNLPPPAFTLIELIVVIAIIGILAGLLLPSLVNAKSRAQAAACMNNSKQLMMGWTQYAPDNNDKCVNNFGSDQTVLEIKNGTFGNWVNNVMNWHNNPASVGDVSNTNEAWVKNGLLARYLSGTLAIYKCPSDNYLTVEQRALGWKARLRSISMNAYLGPFSRALKDQTASTNKFDRGYRQFTRLAQIPDPSMIWVTMDENANSINDAMFLTTRGNEEGWNDAPAFYHNKACGIAFADGHTEVHTWLGNWVLNERLAKISQIYGHNKTVPFEDTAGRHDYLWLWARTSLPVGAAVGTPSP